VGADPRRCLGPLRRRVVADGVPPASSSFSRLSRSTCSATGSGTPST
jgi:hypothetical protein